MATLRIDIPLRAFEQKKADFLVSFFSNLSAPWVFYQKETTFRATTQLTVSTPKGELQELAKARKKVKMFPQDAYYQKELQRCEKNARERKQYDIIVSFEGDIAAEIDENCRIISHYTGPIPEVVTHRAFENFQEMIADDFFDDFYHGKIKKFLIALIMSCVLTIPNVHLGFGTTILYVNGIKYQKETFIDTTMHASVFEEHSNILQEQVSFDETFSWVRKYTCLEVCEQKPPVPFAMLTYLLNRDEHESLLYSVIGLEFLYSARAGIENKLKKRIPFMFPTVTEEQIENIYNRRSEFVHGKVEMSMCKDYTDMMDGIFPFDEASFLACAIFIETIRKMIKNNAARIAFDVQDSYRYIKFK